MILRRVAALPLLVADVCLAQRPGGLLDFPSSDEDAGPGARGLPHEPDAARRSGFEDDAPAQHEGLLLFPQAASPQVTPRELLNDIRATLREGSSTEAGSESAGPGSAAERRALSSGGVQPKQRTLSDHDCPTFVKVSSGSTVAKQEMGLYKNVLVHGSKPVYQMVNTSGGERKPYLYYYLPFHNWRIGYDFHHALSQITSDGGLHECPTDVKKWYDFENGKWSEDDLKVVSPIPGEIHERPDGDFHGSIKDRHEYTDAGSGACGDGAGKYTDSYYIRSSNVTRHLCQAHCDATSECEAFTVVHGKNCTLWALGRPSVPTLTERFWTFRRGNGADEATKGAGGDSELSGSCMVKITSGLASQVEGQGFVFYLIWLFLPLTALCCIAGVYVLAYMSDPHWRRQFKSKRLAAVRASSNEPDNTSLLKTTEAPLAGNAAAESNGFLVPEGLSPQKNEARGSFAFKTSQAPIQADGDV